MHHNARLIDRVVAWCGGAGGVCMVAVALGLLMQPAHAEELIKLNNPLVCSADPASRTAPGEICEVTQLGAGRNKIKVNLTAKMAEIEVGGYKVKTENYNDAYLSPVVQAMPGDTVAAHLENSLEPRNTNDHQEMSHGFAGENPTNLHFFHGGIVTPNNARPPVFEIQIPPGFKGFIERPESGLRGACAQPIPDIDAGKGNGDNIYVRLKNGKDEPGKANSFDYCVPIPGEKELDARVLEGEEGTFIPHPSGLNWYHSHLHRISSDQVMGGLSGLLSIGDDKANLRAKCEKDAPGPQCDKVTAELKKKTDARYVLLRDLPIIKMINNVFVLPEDAKGDAVATWDPEERDFPKGKDGKDDICAVWKKPDSKPDQDAKLRKGFCQRTKDSAWLFTLNGQRFPTITVEENRNLLLRIGNLSANVAYWLELYNESSGIPLPLTILSLDGVVPATPVNPEQAKTPVDAFAVNDLLLMPASRAEFYVRNDKNPPHAEKQVYILRTKELNTGKDKWPEIQLARIELLPNRTPLHCARLERSHRTTRPPIFSCPKKKNYRSYPKDVFGI